MWDVDPKINVSVGDVMVHSSEVRVKPWARASSRSVHDSRRGRVVAVTGRIPWTGGNNNNEREKETCYSSWLMHVGPYMYYFVHETIMAGSSWTMTLSSLSALCMIMLCTF